MNEYNSIAFNYEDQGEFVTAAYFYRKVIELASSCKVCVEVDRISNSSWWRCLGLGSVMISSRRGTRLLRYFRMPSIMRVLWTGRSREERWWSWSGRSLSRFIFRRLRSWPRWILLNHWRRMRAVLLLRREQAKGNHRREYRIKLVSCIISRGSLRRVLTTRNSISPSSSSLLMMSLFARLRRA